MTFNFNNNKASYLVLVCLAAIIACKPSVPSSTSKTKQSYGEEYCPAPVDEKSFNLDNTTCSTDSEVINSSTNEVETKEVELLVTKASEKKGMDGKQPVNLDWDSIPGFKTLGSTGTNPRDSDYIALPLAKLLIDTFKELNKNLGLIGIRHLGIYNYRKIAGSGNLSRHSYARAIDISALIVDGNFFSELKNEDIEVNVERDWIDSAEDQSTESKILHVVRDYFCAKGFSIVLDPEYNEAHKDHYHIDLDDSAAEKLGSVDPKYESVTGSIRLNDFSDSNHPYDTVDDGDEGLAISEGLNLRKAVCPQAKGKRIDDLISEHSLSVERPSKK